MDFRLKNDSNFVRAANKREEKETEGDYSISKAKDNPKRRDREDHVWTLIYPNQKKKKEVNQYSLVFSTGSNP